MHEISRYLPKSIRRRIAHDYVYDHLTPIFHKTNPRDSEGFCPLGRALELLRHPVWQSPPTDVFCTLLNNQSGPFRYAVATFIYDWDHGLITDLAIALDV